MAIPTMRKGVDMATEARVDMLIRSFPEECRRRIKIAAAAKGQTMSEWLAALVRANTEAWDA